MIEKIDRYYLEITSIDKLKDKQKPIDNLKIDLLKSENFEVGIDKEVAQIEKMGFEKEDKVIGLMMYLGDPDDLDLIEHLLVENKEKCFEMKVIAEENSNAYYECAKLEAVVKEGKIIRIIEEIEVLNEL